MTYLDTSIYIGCIIIVALLSLICMKTLKIKSPYHQNQLYVNYHLTRQCNYQCGFCFHTAKTSHLLNIDDAKRGLKLLADYGLKKINFAGGEPFLQKKFLGELLKYSKETLHIEICSVVTNGSISYKDYRWFKKYGKYLDIFAISCDSFKDDINKTIGRFNNSKANQTEIVHKCANLCAQYNIDFKLNTVINAYNWNEDMVQHIQKLNPIRWKVFQCLLVDGENNGKENNAIRDARKFLITDEQFQSFIQTHKSLKALVAEDNKTMRNSYLLLDEYMRFLSNINGSKEPTESILDVGVEIALKQTFFDKESFIKRDGQYKRTRVSKPKKNTNCSSNDFEW